MGAEELRSLRAAVDEVDRAIVAHLAKRRAAVAALAAHKRAAGLGAVDAEREAELRERWAAEARAQGLPEEVALPVLEAILEQSRRAVEAHLAASDRDDEAPRG